MRAAFIFLLITRLLLVAAHAQNHIYDPAGRLIWSSQPSGASTAISYDPAGNITAVVSITAGTDSDGDGIPDSYEIDFTGSPVGLDANEDSSGSGFPNYMAFAFGGNPFRSTGSFVLPVGIHTDSITGTRFLVLQYTRPKEGPLLWSYTPEATGDMVTWSSNPADIAEVSVEDLGGGFERVTLHARITQHADRAFARVRLIRITQP